MTCRGCFRPGRPCKPHMGADGCWCASRSSKPVRTANSRLGGFDPHMPPPKEKPPDGRLFLWRGHAFIEIVQGNSRSAACGGQNEAVSRQRHGLQPEYGCKPCRNSVTADRFPAHNLPSENRHPPQWAVLLLTGHESISSPSGTYSHLFLAGSIQTWYTHAGSVHKRKEPSYGDHL